MKSRKEKAMQLRMEGYNCAQAVLMPFSEELGFAEDKLAILSAGLGGGAGQGELCGVANALAIAEGMLNGDPGAGGKKKGVAGAKRLGEMFAGRYGGCITCRDLKGKCGKTCHELVQHGVEILDSRVGG